MWSSRFLCSVLFIAQSCPLSFCFLVDIVCVPTPLMYCSFYTSTPPRQPIFLCFLRVLHLEHKLLPWCFYKCFLMSVALCAHVLMIYSVVLLMPTAKACVGNCATRIPKLLRLLAIMHRESAGLVLWLALWCIF